MTEAPAFPSSQHLLERTIGGVLESVRRDMPAGAFQDFYLWGVDAANPRRPVFVQLTAIQQLANLSRAMLQGLVDDERDWEPMLRTCAAISAWQVHEVASDNLAFGLGQPARLDDPGQALRRSISRTFNETIIARLQGRTDADGARLRLFAQPWESIRAFELHLAPATYRELADAFAGASAWSVEQVGHAARDQFVANIESCMALLDGVRDAGLAAAIRASLVNRYAGLNELLAEEQLTFERLLAIGADTIMVLPTLGFCLAAMASCLGLNGPMAAAVQDGCLLRALEHASRMIRLMNDIGTSLLACSPEERAEIIEPVRRAAGQAAEGEPFGAVLRDLAGEHPALTRLRKDLEFGEDNVLLHGIAHEGPAVGAAAAFEQRLDGAVRAYRAGAAQLREAIGAMEPLLGDARPGRLIARFVGFHQRLYGNPYDRWAGEYAVY